MKKESNKEKDSNGYFEYMRTVRSAKLLAREKSLLYFYASMYNWDEGKASFASIELIAAWTGMSEASVNRAKKRLLELGWIRSYRKDRYSKVFVWVFNGKEDPNYEKQKFAEHHTYTSKKSAPTFEEAFGYPLEEYPSNQSDSSIYERAVERKQKELYKDNFGDWLDQNQDEQIDW
jgi:hypothetical protein